MQGSSPLNFAVRQSHWYIKNDSLGTVSVGRLNSATKDMPGIELGNIALVANSDMTLSMNNFILRRKGETGREGLTLGRSQLLHGCSTNPNQRVSLFGFHIDHQWGRAENRRRALRLADDHGFYLVGCGW